MNFLYSAILKFVGFSLWIDHLSSHDPVSPCISYLKDSGALYYLLLFSRKVMSNSFATPWTAACQPPLTMGFPRQEYWSGLPFPPPGHLPNLGTEPAFPALAGGFFTTEQSGKSKTLIGVNFYMQASFQDSN